MFITPARIRIIFSLFLTFSVRLLLADATQANLLLQQGRVDEATVRLHDVLAVQPGDAEAHQLLCRVYYAQNIADSAIREGCENLRAYLDVAVTFDGREEIVQF